MKTTTKLWVGLGILVLLSPLGILLPEFFKATDAWGEWGVETVKKIAGYVPQGLDKFANIWKAPIPDYGQAQRPSLLGYIFSALIGVLIVTLAAFLIAKFLSKKNNL